MKFRVRFYESHPLYSINKKFSSECFCHYGIKDGMKIIGYVARISMFI